MSELHADALATLRGWSAPDADQEALRRRLVDHLASHPDGTSRSCHPAHLTAGTLVVSGDGDHVLLNLHGKAGRWFHFGGHCEPDDTTLAGTALREAYEESGLASMAFDHDPIQIEVHVVEFCDPRGPVSHLDVRYGAVADRSEAGVAGDESLAVRWWPVDDLPELDDGMHRLLALTRARLC